MMLNIKHSKTSLKLVGTGIAVGGIGLMAQNMCLGKCFLIFWWDLTKRFRADILQSKKWQMLYSDYTSFKSCLSNIMLIRFIQIKAIKTSLTRISVELKWLQMTFAFELWVSEDNLLRASHPHSPLLELKLKLPLTIPDSY